MMERLLCPATGLRGQGKGLPHRMWVIQEQAVGAGQAAPDSTPICSMRIAACASAGLLLRSTFSPLTAIIACACSPCAQPMLMGEVWPALIHYRTLMLTSTPLLLSRLLLLPPDQECARFFVVQLMEEYGQRWGLAHLQQRRLSPVVPAPMPCLR